MPDSAYALSKKRNEPLTDAAHVRNATVRFDQEEGVSDKERKEALEKLKAAKK